MTLLLSLFALTFSLNLHAASPASVSPEDQPTLRAFNCKAVLNSVTSDESYQMSGTIVDANTGTGSSSEMVQHHVSNLSLQTADGKLTIEGTLQSDDDANDPQDVRDGNSVAFYRVNVISADYKCNVGDGCAMSFQSRIDQRSKDDRDYVVKVGTQADQPLMGLISCSIKK